MKNRKAETLGKLTDVVRELCYVKDTSGRKTFDRCEAINILEMLLEVLRNLE